MKRSQGKPTGRGLEGPRSGFSGFGGFGTAASGTSLSYLAEPPSFAAVSDPNVVVSLKNILKKDSTTKAKALEELLAYVQAHPFDKDGGVEEDILDVWVQIYPRTSIDNSRRVRELTHNLQFELMKSARKRFERHLPKIVGAWLAGLYDRDRVVARAASDGLTSFLNTPEKVLAFWTKCQGQILDYAIDAIQETQDTLSDERSTTAEDAEAKYYRVVTASLSLVLSLLQKVEPSHLEKLQSRYHDFFAEENVWKTITFNDSSVRKTVCQLLFATIDRKLPYADDAKVKQAFITGGLKTNQAGSALEYVRALTKMTQTYPDVWTSTKTPTGPKSPLGRLQAFVAKGSQGSPPKFWEYLDQLLMVLPSDLITPEVASQFLSSLKSGITHRDEPRTNTSYAWKCFIDTAKRLLKNLPAEDQLPFVQEHLFPLIEQFLFSVSEKTVAIPLGPNAISVLVEAYIATVQASPSVVSASKEEWDRLASVFCAKISGSLPEVSREYQQSQEKISEEGRRWFGLVGQIEEKIGDLEEDVPDHTAQPSLKAISQSITLLESRNLKPFGAARIIEYALSMAPRLFDGEGAVMLSTFFTALARDDAAKTVTSPSSRYLLSSLHLFGSVSTQFAPIWNSWVEAVLDLPSEATRDVALASLISNDRGAVLAKGNMDLQKHIIGQAVLLAVGGSNDWELLEAAVTYQTLTDSNYRDLVQALVEILEKEPSKTESTLQALEITAKGRPELFSRDERVHTTLVALLLGLSELEDSTISSKATAIRNLLDTHTDGKLPVVAVVQANLERAGTQSLDINTLVSQAYNAVSSDIPSEELFPSTNVWMKELAPLLELSVNPALSITNSIGGAAALVKGAPRSANLRIYRDRKGRAIPARMALYVSQLSEKLPLSQLPKPFQLELLYLQCLTVQLISDQITCMEENRLWQTLKHAEGSAQAEEFVSKTRGILNQLAVDASAWSDSEEKPIIQDLIDLLTQHSQELTPRGLYSARALSELVQFLAEAHGASSSFEDALLKPDVLKISPTTVLPASAIITGFGETLQPSKIANNFCNKVVSEIAGAKADSDKTLMTLVLLSQCAQIYEAGEMPVANNRIVFAVRQITSWLEEPESLSPALCAEICRALNKLLPCMKDVYGSYWEKTIEFCISLWNRAHEFELNEALPFIHSSLKLFKTIESLQEPNDDLEDALKEYASAKPRALIELLRLPRDTRSQPLEIVDAMLCREAQKISLRHVPDLSDIFGLVASESRDIQTAAFNLLHQALPEQQQQKSIDALLEKTGMCNGLHHEDQELTVSDARLPDELLSLLLDAPTLEKYSDEMLAEFPSPIRSYLLSWKLVFDAYSTSSFKIRNDFTDNLKQDNCVGPLLDFMFDVLGHSAAHPLKLEKVNLTSEHIQDYDVKLAESEPEEKDMQWLLVHLFYLLHKYTPGLFRAWYIDCRSKQTRIAVESWTTKYFSPIIVSDVLDEVQKWADSQEPPAMDEKELVVRVARSSREIIAGYEVDEDQAAIAIKIPQNYPIENVSVQSLNRVAVNEKKWQSWIMTTQGVITFSNGNIIDGLQVFKRNILGALKGQSECAICYSIISTDKRMPDKRCTTCKNLFHRTCLYKWFQSSNQNTCPLCRNPIDYLGSDTKRRQG